MAKKKTAKSGRPTTVLLDTIEFSEAALARIAIDQATVDAYAADMAAGDKFPPIVVFDDGEVKWMADGHHRFHAAIKSGLKLLNAQILKGSRHAAAWFACGANQGHGLRRSNADKAKAVKIALNLIDEGEIELPKGATSDRAIGDHCGVDHKTVSAMRKGQVGNFPTSRTGQDGKKYPVAEPKSGAADNRNRRDDGKLAPSKDETGHPIPSDLAEAWAAADEFADDVMRELSSAFHKVSESFKKEGPETADISKPLWERAVKELRDQVRVRGTPHAVCPHCNGLGTLEDKKCHPCNGRGWMSKRQWAAVSDELRKGREGK